MIDQDSVPALQRGNKIASAVRMVVGAVVGLFASLNLLILGESVNLPMIGPVVTSQHELFSLFLFERFYERVRDTFVIYNAATSVYAGVWAVIGALLFSKKRVSPWQAKSC